MSIVSLVPEVYVDVKRIPDFLPWGLRYNAFYPYSDLFSHIVNTQATAPPWDAELEAYYRTFHPDVWLYLMMDHHTDASALESLRGRLDALRQSGLVEDSHTGAALEDLEVAIGMVEARLRKRWEKIFGLRDIRDKYFRMHGVYAGGTDYYCVDDHLNDLQFPAPAAAQHSLWPLSYRPEGNDATPDLRTSGGGARGRGRSRTRKDAKLHLERRDGTTKRRLSSPRPSMKRARPASPSVSPVYFAIALLKLYRPTRPLGEQLFLHSSLAPPGPSPGAQVPRYGSYQALKREQRARIVSPQQKGTSLPRFISFGTRSLPDASGRYADTAGDR
ncbi:hypothetical protein NBRC10512v2_000993 [Rhodotorula toruloides]